MMIRPPGFRCLSAACVATNVPRTLIANTRSKSARVVSSTGAGTIVPALFTNTSSRPSVLTVFSTAFLTASASAASAWMAIAFVPPRSISLTTADAASALGVGDGDAGAPSRGEAALAIRSADAA